MTTDQRNRIDYYTHFGAITDPGELRPMFEGLPAAIEDLARVVQGLFLHEHIAPQYGVTVSDERRQDVHIRPVEARLRRIRELDGRPLTVARPPAERTIGNCRHITLMLVSMLRNQGTAARARCGFGAYFEPGRYGDHWVGEYWNTAQQRWVMVDAQIDDVQRGLFHPDFDLLDVPRDRFLIAGDAWRLCRSGAADPAHFGILDMHGLWFIAGNLIRDVAALNNMEMLPWDVWGAMPQPGQGIDEPALAFFDRLAELSHDADAHFEELVDVYEREERVRVPATVLNAVLNRPEQVWPLSG